MPWRANPQPPLGCRGQRVRLAWRQPFWLTYSSSVRSLARRSCTGHRPARRQPWRASFYPEVPLLCRTRGTDVYRGSNGETDPLPLASLCHRIHQLTGGTTLPKRAGEMQSSGRNNNIPVNLGLLRAFQSASQLVCESVSPSNAFDQTRGYPSQRLCCAFLPRFQKEETTRKRFHTLWADCCRKDQPRRPRLLGSLRQRWTYPTG